MQQEYKKPLLIFFSSLIILACLVMTFFLAFNYGRKSIPTTTTYPANYQKIYPTSFPKIFPTSFPKISQTVSPTASSIASPTIASSPIPTLSVTPKPTGSIFNIAPLKIFQPSETQILKSNATLDGYRSSNNGGSNTLEIWVGRNNVASFRGFVSFDLKSLPSNITIEKATIKMYQMGIVGKPYVIGGNVVVDHLNYGTSLESSDYDRVAIKMHIGVLSNNDVLEVKNLEVTDSVRNDLYYNRGRSQYRLRFATETVGGNSSGDITYFDPEENLYQNHQPPQLEITFKKN